MILFFYQIISTLIWLYMWAVIIAAVFSMLAAFGVLDTRNRVVWTIGDFLYRFTEPVLRPIRNLLPNFGGIDISPVIVIVILAAVNDKLLPWVVSLLLRA
ncbi:MAG: YggT family protein [Acetobacteraceae bacterium]